MTYEYNYKPYLDFNLAVFKHCLNKAFSDSAEDQKQIVASGSMLNDLMEANPCETQRWDISRDGKTYGFFYTNNKMFYLGDVCA